MFLVFSVFLVVFVLVAMVWERSLWVSKGRYLYDIGGFLLIQVAFKILFQFQSRGWCLYLLALLEDLTTVKTVSRIKKRICVIQK